MVHVASIWSDPPDSCCTVVVLLSTYPVLMKDEGKGFDYLISVRCWCVVKSNVRSRLKGSSRIASFKWAASLRMVIYLCSMHSVLGVSHFLLLRLKGWLSQHQGASISVLTWEHILNSEPYFLFSWIWLDAPNTPERLPSGICKMRCTRKCQPQIYC